MQATTVPLAQIGLGPDCNPQQQPTTAMGTASIVDVRGLYPGDKHDASSISGFTNTSGGGDAGHRVQDILSGPGPFQGSDGASAGEDVPRLYEALLAALSRAEGLHAENEQLRAQLAQAQTDLASREASLHALRTAMSDLMEERDLYRQQLSQLCVTVSSRDIRRLDLEEIMEKEPGPCPDSNPGSRNLEVRPHVSPSGRFSSDGAAGPTTPPSHGAAARAAAAAAAIAAAAASSPLLQRILPQPLSRFLGSAGGVDSSSANIGVGGAQGTDSSRSSGTASDASAVSAATSISHASDCRASLASVVSISAATTATGTTFAFAPSTRATDEGCETSSSPLSPPPLPSPCPTATPPQAPDSVSPRHAAAAAFLGLAKAPADIVCRPSTDAQATSGAPPETALLRGTMADTQCHGSFNDWASPPPERSVRMASDGGCALAIRPAHDHGDAGNVGGDEEDERGAASGLEQLSLSQLLAAMQPQPQPQQPQGTLLRQDSAGRFTWRWMPRSGLGAVSRGSTESGAAAAGAPGQLLELDAATVATEGREDAEEEAVERYAGRDAVGGLGVGVSVQSVVGGILGRAGSVPAPVAVSPRMPRADSELMQYMSHFRDGF